MESRTGTFLAAASGVLFFVLALTGGLIAGELDLPEPTDPPATVVEFYQTTDFDQMYWGVSIEILGFLLLVVFAARLADVLGTAEQGSRWLTFLILSGLALTMVMVLVSYAPWVAGSFRASRGGLPDEGYLLLHDLQFAFYPLFLMTASSFLLPTGIAMLRTGLFPRWLGWTAALLAPAMFLAGAIDPTSLRVADLFAGLWSVWILVAAGFMLTHLEAFSGTSEIQGSGGPAEASRVQVR